MTRDDQRMEVATKYNFMALETSEFCIGMILASVGIAAVGSAIWHFGKWAVNHLKEK